MIIQSPGEIAFYILNFPVYWYGIILACAVLAGVIIAEHISKDFPENFFINNSPMLIITGIIGARLYYCLVNFSYYMHNPVEIFDIRQGGMSIHGMIIAGILTVYFIAKKNKISFLKVSDVLVCATAFAQSIGRWGNFFNSEAYGLPTAGSWGVFIPSVNRIPDFELFELYHPAFLYESVLNLFVFFVLLFIFKKAKRSGIVFFWYLVLYALVRIFVEYFRMDCVYNIFGLSIAQIVSVLMLQAGAAGLYILSRKNN